MQAIMTKYLPPTNFRGARIKAWAEAGQTFMPWQHALDAEQNHIAAARRFARLWGWTGYWVEGGTADGSVFVCVLPDDEHASLADVAAFCLVFEDDSHRKVVDRPTQLSIAIDARMPA